MKYKYRVYVSTIRDGFTYCRNNNLSEAETKFKEAISSGYGAVYLQEMNIKFGWVKREIKVYETDFYKSQKKAYWKRREEEENWRAGDAPWDAPGMSVRDFI